MSVAGKLFIAALAALGLSATAYAGDLRSCSQAELDTATLAPMPKEHPSLSEFTSDATMLAGYLIAIDGTGHPAVVCAIDTFTPPELREPGAAAVGKFVYWPEDATPKEHLAYVHLQSQHYGLTIPSVLPRMTDPECDWLHSADWSWLIKPIYREKIVYPLKNMRKGNQAGIALVAQVLPSGAVRLTCRAVGTDNLDLFVESVYYGIAGWRYPPNPLRAPFPVVLTIKFLMRD